MADPARRRPVEGRLDLDAAVEMDGALAKLVIAKRLDGQRPERRPFLGKHHRDLALRGAMDARVGPVRVPAIEIGLRRLDRVEALAVQRRLLGVADADFDFAFPIGIADATRHRDDAVVREHVAIERIERRVVDVGREHALFEVVEDDDGRGAAQTTKGPLVQLAPDLRARAPCQQPHGFARARQREDEESRASVLAGRGPAHHRALAVIDLAFFTGRAWSSPRAPRAWCRRAASRRSV